MNHRQIDLTLVCPRAAVLMVLLAILTVVSPRLRAGDIGICGGAEVNLPFTDVATGNIFFCSIAAAYFSGLTNGTSPTTYSPSANVPREQMAAFVSRTLDQSLRRGSRRAALKQWWTSLAFSPNSKTAVDLNPQAVASDGADLWVTNLDNGRVTRVRASDGVVLQTWTGAIRAAGVLVAQGAVFITGETNPGRLYAIVPTTSDSSPPVTLVTDQLGANPRGIAFDGTAIWTANQSGSISRVVNGTVTTVSTGFVTPVGMLYDGANIWVSDPGDGRLKKLNSDGSIAAFVQISSPYHASFDGTNIWVPSFASSAVTVVRVKDTGGNPLNQPFVLATLTDNGLSLPTSAAFDGQRIVITNLGSSVSLWEASDLTPLGSVPTGSGTAPFGVCSDGVNFWVVLNGTNQLLRF
jgi:hypothetical protein